VREDDPQADALCGAESWHFTEADQDMDRVFVSPIEKTGRVPV
jgi:hypothetical protein